MSPNYRTRRAIVSFALAALWLIPASSSAQTPSIDIWWPTPNVSITGTQPLKALLQNYPVSDYQMFWQVDQGERHEMWNSYADYPHKEYSVNLNGWTWRGNGPYVLNFIASRNGQVIAQRSLSIYVPNSSNPTPTASGTNTTPVATLTSSPLTSTSPILATDAPKATVVTTTTKTVAAAELQIWWPTPEAILSGTQPFKGVLPNYSLNAYKMFWQVDNGGRNEMPSNHTDAPHKEALVNLSGWTWKGSGPYTLTFTAVNSRGVALAKKSFPIYIGNGLPRLQPTTTNQDPTPTSPPSLSSFYVDPNSTARAWATAHQYDRPADAALMNKIADQPTGIWLGGWSGDIRNAANEATTKASAAGSTPIFIAYNIPYRDCGGYSAGGTSGADAYRSWISGLKSGIGTRKALVILEPDALAGMDCLSGERQQERLSLLRDAVTTLGTGGNTSVYIDAGHPGWITPDQMAHRLQSAGVSSARGFSLNVSNFVATDQNLEYGNSISSRIGKRFVIDTSRNGVGSNGEWCNPSGRALGKTPTTDTSQALVDAFLWAKKPGESDGNCNGGPSAGTFWPEYALDLARRAGW